MKKCTKCGIEKTYDFFKKTKQTKTGYSSWCKSCHSIQTCKNVNREKANKNNALYVLTSKGKISREKHLKSEARKNGKKRYNDGESGKLAQSRWRANRGGCHVENTLTKDQWIEIVLLQKNRCKFCKIKFNQKDKPQKDHIIPLSKGGGLTSTNVQALCRSCNSRKYNKVLTLI